MATLNQRHAPTMILSSTSRRGFLGAVLAAAAAPAIVKAESLMRVRPSGLLAPDEAVFSRESFDRFLEVMREVRAHGPILVVPWIPSSRPTMTRVDRGLC